MTIRLGGLRTRSARLGALALLLVIAPLVALFSTLTAADAAPRTADTPPSSVQVHTWVEPAGAQAPRPAIGPVLDGALLTTPTAIAVLTACAAVAGVMATRAAQAAKLEERR